jgi:large subunit ribosomal protein L35
MPKLKTKRSAAKRFQMTKSGKVKYKKAYSRHHAWAKNRKQKRHLRAAGLLNKTETKEVHALMPYA